jgi:hypothetical protein
VLGSLKGVGEVGQKGVDKRRSGKEKKGEKQEGIYAEEVMLVE